MQSMKTKTKSYPAPTQVFLMQTDLAPQELKAVTEAVNPLIADAFALYVKTKNFHWHLYGSHFRDYHLLFDEQAEAIFDSIDVMAERVRKVGGTTIRSIGHIASSQTIEDDNSAAVPPKRWFRIFDGRQRPHGEDDTRCNQRVPQEPRLCHEQRYSRTF